MHAKQGYAKRGTKEHMHTQHEGMHLHPRDTTIYTYIHACIHTYIHTYIHHYMDTYVHMFVSIYYQIIKRLGEVIEHTHIYVYMFTYMHACMHTYTRLCLSATKS